MRVLITFEVDVWPRGRFVSFRVNRKFIIPVYTFSERSG
jgi:hypothetical protein